MVKNYIKIAWRSIVKNRFFSLLNIFGLAVSLTVAILLITYGRQELSYNTQFKQQADIYRVYMQATEKYNYEKWAELPNSVGPTMLTDIPEVERTARLVQLDFTGFGSVLANEKNFIEKNIFLTDSSFFTMFDFAFTEGNARTAFLHPKSVVISATEKEKMFGNEPALNKKLIVNQRDTLTISGVFQNLPANSSFKGDMYTNIMDSWMGENVHWSNASYQTFCILKKGADVAAVEKKTTALIDKYVPKENQYYTQFFLQPLAKIHLYSADIRDDNALGKGSITAIRTVFILSFLIVFIACINYMNLATARSEKNAKEVGVNKVLGAHRNHIKLRFYLETAFISFFSIAIGLLLAVLVVPLFNQLIGTTLPLEQLLSWQNLLIMGAIWLITTLVGGSYPALLMSNLPSLALMKKMVSVGRKTPYLRTGLVIFQFTSSIVLIIGVIIISLQMKHVADKDLGYKPSNVLIVPIRSINSADKFNSIKQSISDMAGTASIATVQTFPGYGESGKNISRPGTKDEGLPILTSSSRGAVVPTVGLHLLAGTDLPETLAQNDTTCYILINEVVSSYLGFKTPNEAVGQRLATEMADNSVIVGVVRNFNFLSLKEAVGGYVYYRIKQPSESYRYFMIRYNTKDVQAYVSQVQQVFNQQIPDAAFDYQFLDDHIKSYYTAENRTNHIITVFSILTISIACLGLFGLMAFTAEQRKKEIGVRKVLGANVYTIVRLLSGNFLGLVLLSFLIASPIAWWLFNAWLQDFTYKISIPWWSFLIAGLAAVGMAIVTVSYQAFKAAKANPVDSLRDE